MSERSLVNSDKPISVRQEKREATRERILDAAAKLVRTMGVAAATTKRIAAEAGVAEGSLYNHFPDKAQLLVHLVLERLPGIRDVFVRLVSDTESRPLEIRLTAALAEMIAFYDEALPILGGISADPDLLRQCRVSLAGIGGGPQRAHEKLASILTEEQRQGRMNADADPQTIAFLLIGSCTEYAILSRVLGAPFGGLTPQEHARKVMNTLRPVLLGV